MHEAFHSSPAFRSLEPLRIPAGWAIGWNNLHRDYQAEYGDFGGSSVWRASNAERRFVIDVEFRPEHDPEGHFILNVEYYPWPRNHRGRRAGDGSCDFRGSSEVIERFETKSYAELIAKLEFWIATCSVWAKEQS